MSRVFLIGGPLDGKSRVVRSPLRFLWAEDGEGATVRFFRAPAPDRHLYRFAGAVDGEKSYLYAGHLFGFCCGAFYGRPQSGAPWRCVVCGAEVREAATAH